MAQKLILFENIINSEAIKSNQSLKAELEKLAEYVFDEADYQIEDAKEKGDDIQGWCNDELYKAIVNDYCTAFRFKTAFEIVGEGYAGPVMGWFFEPDGALDDQIVVLTCESNGLFKNPRYVCGLLIDEDDLERLLGDFGKEVEDEEDEEDWDDEEDAEEEEEDDEDDEDDDEEEEEFPVERLARKHIFLYPIHATVGQIVKDLEAIIERNPDSYLSFSDENANDYYIKGTKEWNGLIILKTSWEEDDAIYVEDLLEELDGQDDDTKVVLEKWWELRDITPEDDGSIFWYDEEEEENRFYDDDHDIRLFSGKDLANQFKDFAERYPDRKVVCLADDGKFYPVSNLFDDDSWACICLKEDSGVVTASVFAVKLDYIYSHGVVVKFLKRSTWASIANGDGGVFFEAKVDGEDVVAFRLGETVADWRVEDEEDTDDFLSEDDTVVTVDDLRDEMKVESVEEPEPEVEEDVEADSEEFEVEDDDEKEEKEETKRIPEFSKDDFIPSGNVEGHGYVDLGLPSGLKWAACNIGASSPEEYGDYFAWGETEPKDEYCMESYSFFDCADPDDPDAHYIVSEYNEEDGQKELDSVDDAAAVNWKGPWRMPAEKDFQELIDNCEWTWGEFKGTVGFKVKGPNGSCIFLPAASTMEYDSYWEEGEGDYWSLCLDDDTYEYHDYEDYYIAQILSFNESSGPYCFHRYRDLGNPIRPVCYVSDEKPEPGNDSEGKGDIILKLVSYSGSVIKMMTALSGIDGIDEEVAFNKLQKLPAVILEGVSAKKAMTIGAMLEEVGAKIELARASDPAPEENAPEPAPEPAPVQPAPAPEKPKPAPMEYVDLGLSVKWAKCNLGASAPEEFGDYYAWGETEKHDNTAHKDYKFFFKGRSLTKYNTKETYGKVVDNIKQLELSDDAAHQILGGGWRMPTMKEAEELKKNCKVFPATINGVKGLKIVSKIKGYTDKWIFLPAAGFLYYDKRSHIRTSDHCFYWTSSLYTRRPDCGLTIFCNDVYEGKMDRGDGLSIRAVTK